MNVVDSLAHAEEIFAEPEAVWPSPDGQRLAYASFNDSEVGIMSYPWFHTASSLVAGAVHAAGASFPEARTVRYPTPGSRNPVVQLWVIDVLDGASGNVTDAAAGAQSWPVRPPATLEGQEFYVTSVGWVQGVEAASERLSVVWMTRAQNLSIISMCVAPQWQCIEVSGFRIIVKCLCWV